MVVELEPDRLETEAVREGYSADGDERHICLYPEGRATGRWFDGCLQYRPARIDRRHPGSKLETDALSLQDALELPGNLGVDAGQDAVEKLHYGDLGAETPPHRAELKADHPGADDQQMPRNFLKQQCAGRRHDPFLVDCD